MKKENKIRIFRIIGVVILLVWCIIYAYTMVWSFSQVNLSKAPNEVFYYIFTPVYTLCFGLIGFPIVVAIWSLGRI